MKNFKTFIVLLLTVFPLFVSAQEYLVITEQTERQTTAKMPDNTAEAVFIASTNDLIISSSNKSVDKFKQPVKNEQGLYEYVVVLDLSGNHNTRFFRVNKSGSAFFGETMEKSVFTPGERHFFVVTEPVFKFAITRNADKTHLVQNQACIEITSPIEGILIDVSQDLYCDINTNETDIGTYVTTININTASLDFFHRQHEDGEGNIKEEDIDLWKDVTSIRLSFPNSNIVTISIDGIKQREKHRYTIIPQSTEKGSKRLVKNGFVPATFFTLNGAYSPTPYWACGFKVGQMKMVGWYFSCMTNFMYKGMFHPFVQGEQYDLTGKSSTARLSIMGGLVVRVAQPVAIHVGAGFGYFAQTFETESDGWHALPKNTYLGADVALGLSFHIKQFMLTVEAVTTNFKTIELKAGLGMAINKKSKYHENGNL